MATSNIPVTVTYTLKFNTYPSAPNAIVKDYNITKTISLPVGITEIGAFTSVNKPTITYIIK
jgi:hypothetical protein